MPRGVKRISKANKVERFILTNKNIMKCGNPGTVGLAQR
jgi:hypothetical protein